MRLLRFQTWLGSTTWSTIVPRIPGVEINGVSLKPNLFPVDKVFNGDSVGDQAKHVLTGGIL
jgi:hypothetical protein